MKSNKEIEKTQIISMRTGKREWASFTEHLEKIFQSTELDIENHLEDTSIEEDEEIKLVTPKEVTRVIKSTQ